MYIFMDSFGGKMYIFMDLFVYFLFIKCIFSLKIMYILCRGKITNMGFKIFFYMENESE